MHGSESRKYRHRSETCPCRTSLHEGLLSVRPTNHHRTVAYHHGARVRSVVSRLFLQTVAVLKSVRNRPSTWIGRVLSGVRSISLRGKCSTFSQKSSVTYLRTSTYMLPLRLSMRNLQMLVIGALCRSSALMERSVAMVECAKEPSHVRTFAGGPFRSALR